MERLSLRGRASQPCSKYIPLGSPLKPPATQTSFIRTLGVGPGVSFSEALPVTPNCSQVENTALALGNFDSTFVGIPGAGVRARTQVSESCEPCFPNSALSLHSDLTLGTGVKFAAIVLASPM